ncbi:MAG: hypothetical protein VX899_25675 [Myxococcota bacterium]|nr:hypothetical protein [Myxococcota bacterium]
MKTKIRSHAPGPAAGPDAPESPAPPLLSPQGPSVVLGGADPLIGPVAPRRDTLFGPRGACLLDADGPLWVADTGHHRLLGWAQRPTQDDTLPDWVLGQPDFESEGRNAGGEPGPNTLNVPTGVAPWGARGLAVADGWNNRVLVWFERPTDSGVPADLVLGQADFGGMDPNRGKPEAHADTMHWPFQILVHQGRLYVADTGNRRVLVWRTLPTENGQPADFVLGQDDLDTRSDNGGGDADLSTMRWPHDLAVLDGRLVVTDAGNNRVMIWDGLPDQTRAPAQIILGQSDARGVDHNQGKYWPDAACLNMPYAVAASEDGVLMVGDTANSRLVGFTRMETGAPAAALSAQPHFKTKGDNRWGPTVRDSICWPYGIQAIGEMVVLADTGNHRILLWPRQGGLGG